MIEGLENRLGKWYDIYQNYHGLIRLPEHTYNYQDIEYFVDGVITEFNCSTEGVITITINTRFFQNPIRTHKIIVDENTVVEKIDWSEPMREVNNENS